MSEDSFICPICKVELKTRIFEMQRIFICPNCQRVFDKSLQLRFSRIEVVDINIREDMNLVRRISREFGHIVLQFLERRTHREFDTFDVIPIIIGTNARALFSPSSDIDVWIITPDNSFKEITQKAQRLQTVLRKDSLTSKRLNYANRPFFPREVSKKGFADRLEVNCISRWKILNKLQSGHADPRAKPFQTPQQIILSASVSAIDSRTYKRKLEYLREELVSRYKGLAEKMDFQMDRLFAGTYAFNIIGHLCFGIQNSEYKELLKKSQFPSDLRGVLEEFQNATFSVNTIPLFKSIAYREWEFLNGTKTRLETLQNISKTLYRCTCDFLPSLRIFLKGNFEDLRLETFAIADRFFSRDERRLLYETQALRLGKYVSVSSKDIRHLAQEILNMVLGEILAFELCPEILKAEEIFLKHETENYETPYGKNE